MTGSQHAGPTQVGAVVPGAGEGVLVTWHRFRSGSGRLVVADVSAAGFSGPGQDRDVPWTIAAGAELAGECGARFGVAYGSVTVLRMLRESGAASRIDLRASVGHFTAGLTECPAAEAGAAEVTAGPGMEPRPGHVTGQEAS